MNHANITFKTDKKCPSEIRFMSDEKYIKLVEAEWKKGFISLI